MSNPWAATVWNWRIDGYVGVDRVRVAVAGALGRPVVGLDAAYRIGGAAYLGGTGLPGTLPEGAVLCDVWHEPGDFPTGVDCYLVPGALGEGAAVAMVALALGRRVLLPDDSLLANRYLLATPDGALRATHVDVAETDEGERWSNVRACTLAVPTCRTSPGCLRSRWPPDVVVPGGALAA